jgi:hypothetical protein
MWVVSVPREAIGAGSFGVLASPPLWNSPGVFRCSHNSHAFFSPLDLGLYGCHLLVCSLWRRQEWAWALVVPDSYLLVNR